MVICDEVSFWSDENGANPDTEVVLAAAPGLARVKDSMLVMISSAHRRAGLLYSRWSKYFGKDDDEVLAVKGTTLQFNPSFDSKTIERSLEEDPERYGAEYNFQWRDDLSAFITRDLLERLIDRNVISRPPAQGLTYIAGCDASGGRTDSFTAAIAHKEKDGSISLDCLFEKKAPFDPGQAVQEIAALMRQYAVRQITGDNYAAARVASAFQKAGVTYQRSAIDRSGVYMNCLPLFTSSRARLLDNPRLISQFAALERRTFPTGKERIDPGPGHDDLANSAAIALSLASLMAPPLAITMPYVFERPRSLSIRDHSNHPGELDALNPACASGPEYQTGDDWLAGYRFKVQ